MPDFQKCSPSVSPMVVRVARVLLGTFFLLGTSACFHRSLDDSVGKMTPLSSPAFSQKLATTAQAPWTLGNRIETLVNGDAFYPPMLQAIRDAKETITFETFAYVPGYVATDFTNALALKAQSGVKVHMILDAVGSDHLGKEHLDPLRASGVEIHFYQPYLTLNTKAMNNRTHRKILITDGRTAFTGGAGFADSWRGDARDENEWRDTQFLIEGPAVTQLQRCFLENWKKVSRTPLTGPGYFPPLSRKGSLRAHFVTDSPENHAHPIAHSMLAAINGAEKSLLLEQPYFIPDRTFRDAFARAVARGVEVKIIMASEKIDSKPCRHASQNYWAMLLSAGVKLYQFEPSMMHAKLLVADSRFSIIGSGNLDDRTFFLNDEVNLHVDSASFAREQTAIFEKDLKRSREITLDTLPQFLAPWPMRFGAWIASPHL